MKYKKIYKEYKKRVEKDYGEKCDDFNINCIVCQQYLCLDIIEDDIDLEKPLK